MRRPPSPTNRRVLMAYSRIPPSSCAEETRKTFDHWGQGFVGVRLSGGRGTISNWWTLAQPWRWTVPRQSAPVSPPPIDDHMLAPGADESVVGDDVAGHPLVLEREELHREVDPLQLSTGDRQVAGLGRAPTEADRVELLQEPAGRQVGADVDARPEAHPPRPPSARDGGRGSRFSILKSGMP